MNRRHEKVDALGYLQVEEKKRELTLAEQLKLQEEEDEREVRRLVGKIGEEGKIIRRLNEDDEEKYERKVISGGGPSSSGAQNMKGGVLPVPSSSVTAGSSQSGPPLLAKMGTLKRKVGEKPKFMEGVIIKKKGPPPAK